MSSMKGRGRVRHDSPPRDSRNGIKESSRGRRGSKPSTRSRDQLKPPPRRYGVPNKTWRSDVPSTTAPQNRSPRTSPAPSSRVDDQNWRSPISELNQSYQQRMSDLYQKLKKDRERERRDAIRDGRLSDPNKPTSLKNAIRIRGTCQNMCPEFERVERIVQLMVDEAEKVTSSSEVKVPSEERMVKRFRRSAAGYDEQLPSDIRPPLVLQKTLDFLLNEVVGGPQPLGAVHKFVWDRTRGIRNDFSIQQVTKVEDLQIAIDCFERIARFHILSLHQLSGPLGVNAEFDHHQEREQLNNTLLSLIYYYDDHRGRITSPNEAEFRSYCIIFEIQDQRPDLEDRAQRWPKSILKDRQVQTALNIYAAAMNTADLQGPLRPRTAFSTAQANPGRFWAMIQSPKVPYLMACVAEIYFNFVRSTALEILWKAYKAKRPGQQKMEDWLLDDMRVALGFDDQSEAQTYCEEYGFGIAKRISGEAYVDLGSIVNKDLYDSNPRRKQIFSKKLVEKKKFGLSLSNIINGEKASIRRMNMTESPPESADSSQSDQESLFLPNQPNEETGLPTPGSSLGKNETSQNPFQKFTKLIPSSAKSGGSTPTSFPTSSSFRKPTPILSSTQQPFPMTKPESATFSPFSTQQTPNNDLFPSVSSPFVPASRSDQPPKSPFLSAPPTLSDFAAQDGSEPFAQRFPKLGGSLLDFTKPSDNETSPRTLTTDQSPFVKATPHEPGLTFGNVSQGIQLSSSNPPSLPSTSIPSASFLAPKLPDPAPHPHRKNSTTPTIQPATETTSPFSFLRPFSTTNHAESKSLSLFPLPRVQPPSIAHSNSESLTAPSITLGSPTSVNSFNNSSRSSMISAATPSDHLDSPVPQSTAAALEPTSINSPSSSTSLGPQSPLSLPATSIAKNAIAWNRQPDSRPAALDSISKSLFLDDSCLLQQFIEYTLTPIISSSIQQVEKENSWAAAREARKVLLSRKYFSRWRHIAWKKGLLRRGKERRRNFARSIQDLSKSRRQQSQEIVESFLSTRLGYNSQQNEDQDAQGRMASVSARSKKRESLPLDLGPPSGIWETKSPTKRKRQEYFQDEDPDTARRRKVHHKRSRTEGNISSSTSVAWDTVKPLTASRLDHTYLGDGTHLNHKTLQKARNLVGNIKLDTTQTDYFRLKSMGINPDTPVVPRTGWDIAQSDDNYLNNDKGETGMSSKFAAAPSSSSLPKASRLPETDHTTTRKAEICLDINDKSRQHLPKNSTVRSSLQPLIRRSQKLAAAASTQQPPKSATLDSTEALLMQVRKVREALAEDTKWFRSMRRNLDNASTPSSTPPPPSQRQETEKEKRLREVKYTPSKTQMRLEKTRANGLLPAGWKWGDWKKEERARKRVHEALADAANSAITEKPLLIGHTIFEPRIYPSSEGSINNSTIFDKGTERSPGVLGASGSNGKTGSSVDDAIEL